MSRRVYSFSKIKQRLPKLMPMRMQILSGRPRRSASD